VIKIKKQTIYYKITIKMDLKKAIRKEILNNFLIKENLQYVKKYISNSNSVKTTAEEWAFLINEKGENIRFNFTSDVLDFKRTSYMLEILMYAILNQNEGDFLLPTTNKTIKVNQSQIEKGIKTFLFPSYDLNKFASLISGGDFIITGKELETLDSYDVVGKIADVLNKIPIIINKYLSGDYFAGSQKSFFNYIQTAIRYPIRDLRKKTNTSVLDTNTNSNDDSRDNSDDAARYEIDVQEQVSIILQLNKKILELIKESASKNNKDVFSTYFFLRFLGEGVTNEALGKTLNHKDIIAKCLNGELDGSGFENDLFKKTQSAAQKFFKFKPEMYTKFRDEHPESFTPNGILHGSKELVKFMYKNAKGKIPNLNSDGTVSTNEKGEIKYIPISPTMIQNRIAKDIKNLFLRDSSRGLQLDKIVSDSGIIDPQTEKPFTGISYLLKLFRRIKPRKNIANPIPQNKTYASELSEALYNEELENSSLEDDDSYFSSNDVLDIAKATVNSKRNGLLKEVRKVIKKILIKNKIK
jgi:hypothetical protein